MIQCYDSTCGISSPYLIPVNLSVKNLDFFVITNVFHFQAFAWIMFLAVVLVTCSMLLLFEVCSSDYRNETMTQTWSRYCLYLFGNIFNQGTKLNFLVKNPMKYKSSGISWFNRCFGIVCPLWILSVQDIYWERWWITHIEIAHF